MNFKYFIFLLSFLIISCGPDWDVRKETSDELISNELTSNNLSDESKTGGLKIIALDVGEGDATLIIAPNGDAGLIDTGLAGSIKSKGDIPELKYLFLSHADNDHDGDVTSFDIAPTPLNAGDRFYLGNDVEIYVLAKDCKYSDGESVPCEAGDDNAVSAAMLITYKSFKYLTTGDLPGGGGNPPYQTMDLESHLGQIAGDVDILHVGHHGSNTSTNQTFLDEIRPEAAIISVGNNNDYWHPHPSVIERLINSGIEVYQTERGWLKDEFMDMVSVAGGNVTIETDGLNYKIEGNSF